MGFFILGCKSLAMVFIIAGWQVSGHGLYHRGMASLAMGFIIEGWQVSGHGLYQRGMASLLPWALSYEDGKSLAMG